MNDELLYDLSMGRNEPFVTGQFTNWEPKLMMNMKDFIDKFDGAKPTLHNLAVKKSFID